MKKRITKYMTTNFNLLELGYDFMGYTFDTKRDLSFHHLIISSEMCRNNCLGSGQEEWNGVILNRFTSHIYLHIIERVDPISFFEITSELIDENIQRKLVIENLRRIREILVRFENEHKHDLTSKGAPLIKPEFTEKRISLI